MQSCELQPLLIKSSARGVIKREISDSISTVRAFYFAQKYVLAQCDFGSGESGIVVALKVITQRRGSRMLVNLSLLAVRIITHVFVVRWKHKA